MATRNRSLARAFAVLEFIADHPGARLHDVSKGCDLAPATALRFLSDLVDLGYARELDRRYGPGSRLVSLARGWQQEDKEAAINLALATLAADTGLSAYLTRRDDDEVVYCDRAFPDGTTLISTTRIGHRAPLFCTGAGKALLAHADEAELAAYLHQRSFPTLTRKTLRSAASLRRQLHEIRRQGYAMDDEECELGVRCLAMALCLPGERASVAISISGPADRFGARQRSAQLAALRRCHEDLLPLQHEQRW